MADSEADRPSWARRADEIHMAAVMEFGEGVDGGATAADVQALRDAGYDDSQILAVTLFAALRVAFSKSNDALGARPDRDLAESAPAPVRAAVSFGREPGEAG